MSAPLACRIAFLMLSAAWPLAAQVSEKEEPVDLARGLVLKADAAKPDAPLAEAAKTQVGSKDFSLAMTVTMPEPILETVLAAQIDDTQGWRLLVTTDGALRMEARVKGKADPFAVATIPGAIAAGSTHHLAVNIVRDAAKPNAGIWLDGVELASGIVPPADLTTTQPLSVANSAQKIHLYHRSLSRPELLALWLDAASTGKPVAKHPAPPANGPRFVPQPNETIALIGGTEAVALAESGDLEALLLMGYPGTHFHFRSLAWEGDTVFRQDRPMNFGDLEQQLRRVNAGTVFVMFGRQECLDRGKAGLEDFRASLEKLLDSVGKVTPNLVLIEAPPFEHKAPPLSDMKTENEALKGYNGVVREVALWRHISSFGFGPPSSAGYQYEDFTIDGCTLNARGQRLLAVRLAVSIGIRAGFLLGGAVSVQSDAMLVPTDKVVQAVQVKNRLWHDYWRPSNWAFLYGDRTQQPSSRDPVNPQLRFFPAEQEKYLPLIKEAEEKIYKLVEETTKKLP